MRSNADVLGLQSLAADLAGVRRVQTLAKPFAITELTSAIDQLLAEAAAG
jgi:hypothetical protein